MFPLRAGPPGDRGGKRIHFTVSRLLYFHTCLNSHATQRETLFNSLQNPFPTPKTPFHKFGTTQSFNKYPQSCGNRLVNMELEFYAAIDTGMKEQLNHFNQSENWGINVISGTSVLKAYAGILAAFRVAGFSFDLKRTGQHIINSCIYNIK